MAEASCAAGDGGRPRPIEPGTGLVTGLEGEGSARSGALLNSRGHTARQWCAVCFSLGWSLRRRGRAIGGGLGAQPWTVAFGRGGRRCSVRREWGVSGVTRFFEAVNGDLRWGACLSSVYPVQRIIRRHEGTDRARRVFWGRGSRRPVDREIQDRARRGSRAAAAERAQDGDLAHG